MIPQERIDFLRDYYVATKIHHDSHNKVPWKDRDRDWFLTDMRYVGELHVLTLLFG